MDETQTLETRDPAMTAALPARRAFLLMLSDEFDSETGQFNGRVEHLESGRRKKFSSQEELNSFVNQVLEKLEDHPSAESNPSESRF